MKEMRDLDLAWLAGLVEGEGSIGLLKANYLRQNAPRNVPYIKVTMNDEDVIRRVHELTGIGNVCSFRNRSGTMGFTWQARKRDEVPTLIRLLRPWMGARRRRQIDMALAGAADYGYTSRSLRYDARRVVVLG